MILLALVIGLLVGFGIGYVVCREVDIMLLDRALEKSAREPDPWRRQWVAPHNGPSTISQLTASQYRHKPH